MPKPMTINTMPTPAKSSEPEDIFSNLERAQKAPGRPATGPMMQVPRSGGGMGRTIFTILIVMFIVVALGAGAFWYFLIRPQQAAPQQVIPTPSATSNTPPVPVGGTPSIPTDQGLSPTTSVSSTDNTTLPTPITQPPEGTNIPPPTSVTGNPPTDTAQVADVDTDGDGLSDRRETELGTDPNNPDTDGDGLTDGQEVLTYRTNPLVKDTDGDGYDDGSEVKNGYNPLGSGKCANAECIP
jgi:hypothetical protein